MLKKLLPLVADEDLRLTNRSGGGVGVFATDENSLVTLMELRKPFKRPTAGGRLIQHAGDNTKLRLQRHCSSIAE
jgi:hypothetical protein